MELEVREIGAVYVPEGAVIATLTGFEEQETPYGKRLRLWFRDSKDQFAIWVSPKLNERSNLGRILQGMGFELKPGTRINLNDAVGKKIGLIITKNNRGFARLVGVFRHDEAPF